MFCSCLMTSHNKKLQYSFRKTILKSNAKNLFKHQLNYTLTMDSIVQFCQNSTQQMTICNCIQIHWSNHSIYQTRCSNSLNLSDLLIYITHTICIMHAPEFIFCQKISNALKLFSFHLSYCHMASDDFICKKYQYKFSQSTLLWWEFKWQLVVNFAWFSCSNSRPHGFPIQIQRYQSNCRNNY